MPARYSAAAVSVLGLIGERGSEVKEFIAEKFGAQGLKRSVVLAAPADVPALLRLPCLVPAPTCRACGRSIILRSRCQIEHWHELPQDVAPLQCFTKPALAEQ